MSGLLSELIESLITDPLEEFLSQRVQGCLSSVGYAVFGVLMLGFWYSGFADCENYAARGYRIFFLPACGVVMGLLLYVVAFHLIGKFDSPPWVVMNIAVPFFIPLMIMFWIRERDAHAVMSLAGVFGLLLLILILVGYILEAQQSWPTWWRIVLLIIVAAIVYAGSQLPEPERRDPATGREKYAPLCLG